MRAGRGEGSPDGAVRVPTVPAGRYVLRIAPESPVPVLYRVRVRRDVPGTGLYAGAFLLLLAPPALSALGRQLRTARTPPETEPVEHDDEALTRLA